MCATHGLDAAGLQHHVRQGVTGQVFAHVASHVGPDAEEHALSLVVAGAVLMGLAKVTGDNRPVNGSYDFGQRDRFRGSRQDVAASDAAFGTDEPDALENQQNLLKIRLGQTGALGQVSYGGRPRRVVVQRQT